MAYLGALLIVGLGLQCTAVRRNPFDLLSQPAYDFLNGFVHDLQSGNVSYDCKSDVEEMIHRAESGERSALKMFDAMGKPGSGILEGGIAFPGFFSECLETKMKDNVTGRYCLILIQFTNITKYNDTVPIPYRMMKVGICVPSTCNEKDIQHAATTASRDVFIRVDASLRNCHVNGPAKANWATWFLLSVFGFILLLSLIGTGLELVQLNQSNQKLKTSVESCYESQNNLNSQSSETLYKDKALKEKIDYKGFFLSFSLLNNSKKILSTKTTDQKLAALHGIRFLSMAWIMVGHSFAFAGTWTFFRNADFVTSAPTEFLAQAFANGTFAVDTFFFLGGFLVAHTLFKVLDKTNGKLNYFAAYVHRYLRMTPTMMAVIGFSAVFLKYMGSGPTWKEATMMYDDWCNENWWLNFFYVHNFFRTQHMCLSQTWYSAVDMQFFILAPLIIHLCYRHIYWAVCSITIPMLITTIFPIVYVMLRHLPAIPNSFEPLDRMNDYYKEIYIKPYGRMGPYLVGIALAYFVYRQNYKVYVKKGFLTVGWFAAIAINMTIIYSMGRAFTPSLVSDTESAIYNGFARTAWAVSIAWITLTCISGQAGFVNSILSCPLIVPLSRLTYAAYLIHPVIMAIFYGSRETVSDMSLLWLIYTVLGNLVITYVVSFFISLFFESPITNLEKLCRRNN